MLTYVFCNTIQKRTGVTVLLSTQHNTSFLSEFYTQLMPQQRNIGHQICHNMKD